jgi:hypothetical protein
MRALLPLAALALAAAPVLAQSNLGFENGDLSGWATNGPASAATGYGSFGPHDGTYLGWVQAGLGVGAYSTLSRNIYLTAGQTLSGWAGFQANDYVPFDDSAYLNVGGNTLLFWNISSVGNYGNSGWNAFSFTADSSGMYLLQLGVANQGDNGFPSGAVLDSVSRSAVPEPASWALMLGGFALAGTALRRRRADVRFA